MRNNSVLSDLGETQLIKIIEEIIHEITGKTLIRDDSFFFSLPLNKNDDKIIVLNSDMLVSTTDIPSHMSYYQIGKKSVIMNVSDLIVKGVEPQGILISLGVPKNTKLEDFKELIKGIVDCSEIFNLEYIGGDLGETKEVIVNPTVFGFQEKLKIIYRKGINEGDILVANGKFGLTGVGFDILLNKEGSLKSFPKYKRSIMSVLEPNITGREALIFAENSFATASIDSSDGLMKSLKDLMVSNSKIGFEIDYSNEFIDEEALNYCKEFNKSIEDLVFTAGEEFIHIFTIPQEKYQTALDVINDKDMQLYKIGRAISEEKIYLLKNDEKIELEIGGFEHFK